MTQLPTHDSPGFCIAINSDALVKSEIAGIWMLPSIHITPSASQRWHCTSRRPPGELKSRSSRCGRP